MTGRWNKNKARKTPVETSLGQAPKEVSDLSHLRKPITTSVFGLKQVLQLFQTATSEVQDYVTYECEVLYECKICRTIFRSLANFILHKRSYCREKYNHLGPHTKPEDSGGFVVGDDERSTTPIHPEQAKEETNDKSPEIGMIEEDKKSDKKILPIIDKLVKRQEINILAKNTLTEDLSKKSSNSDDDVIFVSEENNVVLQKIDTSSAAVFQTAVPDEEVSKNNSTLMKSEVMEIHGIFENNEAVLGSNGKVCLKETSRLPTAPNIPKQDLTCTECNFAFSTEKTLTHHIKYKHNRTCIVYPCPDCKETFANAWSVYRHLYKVHRRTSAQVRRMRAQIHSSGIRKDQEPEKKRLKVPENAESEENQWMNSFESDKDLQMCGGCGKRFERKAALHSHSQMCTKRIAVCNNIKENSKTKIESNKQKLIEKMKVNGIKTTAKGSAKRKPMFVQKASSSDEIKPNESERVINGYSELEIIKRLNSKGTLVAKLTTPTPTNLETISEVVIDSDDDEKENSLTPPLSDITITKYSEEESKPDDKLPEIEIFTISDDSSDGTEKKSAKRKRAQSLDLDTKIVKVSEEYKEFLNDELDHCFFTKALPYIDKSELKCVPCQSTYMSQYQLLWHMSLHFSWFRYQCSKCAFMSFNKYDCTTHAYANHGTPNNLMGSTVLPIPKWKVLLASHNFTELSKDEEAKMPCLDKQVSAVVEPSSEDTIVLEDDEMPDICNDSSETVVSSDEEKRGKCDEKAGPSRESGESVAKNRPIRNRVRSVKTLQTDFIYDLAKVLKLNDNSIKNSKLKKTFGKSVKE